MSASLYYMNLDAYLKTPGALSQAELCRRIGAKSAAQIYQWRTGFRGVSPSPAYCVAIERATDGAVKRQDLRDDWQDIWPELLAPAPAAPAPAEAAA